MKFKAMNLEQLKYPIGHFKPTDDSDLTEFFDRISTLPERLKNVVESLSETQLDTPYRPDGWTVRQVVHHIGDSHANAYIRFKWTLTEDEPLIKAYDEQKWAEIFDTKEAPVSMSLSFIDALHAKWAYLLKGLNEDSLNKAYIHPDGNKRVPLRIAAQMYAWHGDHHLAHITSLMEREGWF
ncbi:YfiT family bacillithiol transferase [Fulvivirga ligni]|uniref:YfiT family bacillithiol transferase n=1 Tax=Fulvivirga ligni TaxID=2904246 RepID=UPI001F352122|nr:putative metal-dependent hydrolase [Fulvivirga ligni]UII19291.1 putative metal-dependent hydrolase [Fulvivirga ligni]